MLADSISLNLVELGHFAAHLAMAIALIQGLAPVLARWLDEPRLSAITLNASILVFGLTTVGGAALIHAFVTNNFSVAYVAQHSNTLLPMFYKVTALWGGHEGSLYLWVWILTLFTVLVARHGRSRYPEHLPVILAVQGWLIVGFFGLILFLSSPFERLLPNFPQEGRDLNPILQDPGMVIHPPMLYLGYVGFAVPFAFAIAALLTRWKSELWIGLIRRWVLIAWGFLTAGIMLGGWWAYYELGWGGYWAWDPVENASFMPWLLGTALVHSITVQERRRMLHAWNIFLVISTFALSLLGTFLVRSGVLSSVHAFSVDPGRGLYILTFMILVLSISFGIFMRQGRYQQAQEAISSMLSREVFFIWNNVLFTVASATVMLGTLFPLALDAFSGSKITVGAQYFNAVVLPLFLIILLLMGITTQVPWRKAKWEKLRSRLLVPGFVGVGAGIALVVIYGAIHWTGPVATALVFFVATTIAIDYIRAVKLRRRQLDEPVWRACGKTVLGNRRHYGGMIVHLGILVMAIGFVGSGLFRSEVSVAMAIGDVAQVGNQRIRFDGVDAFSRSNYQTLEGSFTLLNSDRVVHPERRRYPVQTNPTTEAGIDSTLWRDVYVVLSEATKDKWAVKIWVNPLVSFVWNGGFIVLVGLVLTLSTGAGRSSNAMLRNPRQIVRVHLRRFYFLLLLVSVPVFAGDLAEDPLERRMLEIAKDLRCAVCQNQPVSESNSDLARDMRDIISEQLAAGKSREEIVGYFVTRYGNYVLMKPAFEQGGKLLWIAPVLLLLGMAAGTWSFLRNRRQVDLPPAAPLSKEDRARVKAAEAADKETGQKGDNR